MAKASIPHFLNPINRNSMNLNHSINLNEEELTIHHKEMDETKHNTIKKYNVRPMFIYLPKLFDYSKEDEDSNSNNIVNCKFM